MRSCCLPNKFPNPRTSRVLVDVESKRGYIYLKLPHLGYQRVFHKCRYWSLTVNYKVFTMYSETPDLLHTDKINNQLCIYQENVQTCRSVMGSECAPPFLDHFQAFLQPDFSVLWKKICTHSHVFQVITSIFFIATWLKTIVVIYEFKMRWFCNSFKHLIPTFLYFVLYVYNCEIFSGWLR